MFFPQIFSRRFSQMNRRFPQKALSPGFSKSFSRQISFESQAESTSAEICGSSAKICGKNPLRKSAVHLRKSAGKTLCGSSAVHLRKSAGKTLCGNLRFICENLREKPSAEICSSFAEICGKKTLRKKPARKLKPSFPLSLSLAYPVHRWWYKHLA